MNDLTVEPATGAVPGHETGISGVICSACVEQCERCRAACRIFDAERPYSPAEYWRDQYVNLAVQSGSLTPAKATPEHGEKTAWAPDTKSATGQPELDAELRERIRPSIMHVSSMFVPEAQKKIRDDLNAATGPLLDGMAAMVALERKR